MAKHLLSLNFGRQRPHTGRRQSRRRLGGRSPSPRRSPKKLTAEDKLLLSERSNIQCGICIEELNRPDGLGLSDDIDIVKLINCQHKFHKQCILNWANQNPKFVQEREETIDRKNGDQLISCPICRTLSFGIKRFRRKSRK